MTETLPSIVYDAWLRSRGVDRVIAVAGGLSGAVIFRATSGPSGGEAERAWAVRGWPEGISPARVAEVHRATQMAFRAGCPAVPALYPVDSSTAFAREPATQVVAEGRVWECCQWMPGRAPRHGDDVAAALGEAARGLAHFHRAVATLGASRGPAPAVLARLDRLTQLDRVLRIAFRSTPPPSASGSAIMRSGAVQSAIACLREVWDRQRQRAMTLLEPWATRPLGQQYVLRDIHLENTLFVGTRLSGIVDYDALRIDSPATDLARLVGSAALLGPPAEESPSVAFCWPELWSETLAAYRAVCAFSTEEERLARVLADVNPLVILANWVVWVVHERRVFPGSNATILRRIESWTRALREQTERSSRTGH